MTLPAGDAVPSPGSEASHEPAAAPAPVRLAPLVVGLVVIVVGVWLLQGNSLRDVSDQARTLWGGGGGQAVSVRSESGGVASASSPAPRIGALAPDFALRDLDGNLVRLSDLRGKRVVVNFWATWCPPCRAEMPDLSVTQREYRDRGVVILAVDEEENPATVRDFVTTLNLSLTVLLDSDGRVGQAYRVNALPTSFFVDETGVIREIQIGAMNRPTLLAKLERTRP